MKIILGAAHCAIAAGRLAVQAFRQPVDPRWAASPRRPLGEDGEPPPAGAGAEACSVTRATLRWPSSGRGSARTRRWR